MDKTRWNEIQAVLLFAVAVLILISLASFDFGDIGIFASRVNVPIKNFAGLFGAYAAGVLIFVMGMSAYVIPLLIVSWAVARLYDVTPQKLYFKIFGTFFLILASSAIFSIIGKAPAPANGADNSFRFSLGGVVGLVFSDFLIKYLGRVGAIVVIAVLFLLSVLLATEFLLLPFLAGIFRNLKGLPSDVKERMSRDKDEPLYRVKGKRERLLPGREVQARPRPDLQKDLLPKKAEMPVPKILPVPRKPIVDLSQKTPKPVKEGVKVQSQPVVIGGYKIPGLDLLDSPPEGEQKMIKEDFEENARILEETLRDFEIEARVIAYNKGPVITRYELEPAPGVKINKITSLSDNIALAMKAQSIRIVAPIPGKGTIGVELPNSSSTLVYLKEVLDSKEYRSMKSVLKLALGKDIAGAPVVADLAAMPHLLIAGATGSGKSVCVNTIITSLLFNSTPDDIKFIMVDPKRVELAVFNDLPHLLSPVLTDAKKVAQTLEWVVGEMDSRYQLLANVGVRNISMYNEKMSGGKTADGEEVPKKLPYIVVVIDELADLMAVAQNDVEAAITRLAQLSRAVGIHIIIATQRPSVNVITGVIKANFPARISFQVASKVDSRTVLDMNGADKLLGKGDMLFIEPGASRAVRAQCSLISDREIEGITKFIKDQRRSEYIQDLIEGQSKPNFKKFDKDEVYEEAVKTILEAKQASVSILQRRLGVGYTRAARLIDMMEDEGVVGPYQGSKPRDILMSIEEYTAKNGQPQSG